MLKKKRIYGLGIWGLGLGYFLFYTPYSGLTKALSKGLLPGFRGPVKGTVLLPVSVIAVVLGILGFITLMNWWKHAAHRRVFGISIPFPRRLTFLSGICMAVIMATTTLVFTFEGVSIVLVLVLMRAGVLIMAPLVDSIAQRRVRWFSWVAMLISLAALLVALGDAANYKLSVAVIVTLAAYLTAYFIKLQLMSKLAKTDDTNTSLRYFVEEQMVASPLLLIALALMAFIGVGDVMNEFRFGLTTFLSSSGAMFALLVGFCYAGLCICTSLIFLDRRENTFCVPMHCGSSLLAGLSATYVVNFVFHQAPISQPQLVSTGLIVSALVFLSPLHHFQRVLRKFRSLLASIYQRLPGFVEGMEKADTIALGRLQRNLGLNVPLSSKDLENLERFKELRQAFLFVCSGNTCRSPMAAAIGNAEIAARLPKPIAALGAPGLLALSAGISVSAGAPMTAEAQQALQTIGVPVPPHSARNLTVELAHQVDKIFCMTQAHRNAVVTMVPAMAAKTQCLDPNGDVDDPIGKGATAYLNCAERIHSLVRLRFDEIGLPDVVRS